MFNGDNIPQVLKDKKQWVVYRTKMVGNKTNKFMISPLDGTFAKSNDPNSWTTYEKAYRFMMNQHYQGLAFVLTSGLIFIDTDHSIDENDDLNSLTEKLLEELPNTYAERSCSGHGVHIICYGNLPKDALKRNDKIGLEMYDTKRFVCITGDIIRGREKILNYSEKIQEINYHFVGHKKEPLANLPRTNITFNDDELINKIRKSQAGNKFETLYQGDISSYPSWSNADYAFVRILAFWTQDKGQIDAIFRTSGLIRDKWDKRIGDSTYGEITIENALRANIKTYQAKTYEM